MDTKNTISPCLHILLVSSPGQGNVTPMLRLAKCLASKSLLVTFSTPLSYGKEMQKTNPNITNEPIHVGDGKLIFQFLDDEWDQNDHKGEGLDVYANHLERVGKKNLLLMLKGHQDLGRPVSCLINNPFIPWIPEVAESEGIPCALLWVQSCASFSSYYHFYHNLTPFPSDSQLQLDVQLPFCPTLKYYEVPTLLSPTMPPYTLSLKTAMLRQQKNLSKTFCIFMDTFQDLELELIEYMSKICPIKPVGPLFKISSIWNPDSTINADVIKSDDFCIDWLDTQPPSSVIYISFGSIVQLKQEQVTEIAHALSRSDLSFLWVMKETKHAEIEEGLLEEVEKRGKFVQWSPQEHVLAHPSIACFVTHCGWNSSMEAIANGVPVVAFPQWGDQVINAKFLEDVFGVGVRLCRGENGNRIIGRDDIGQCLIEVVSGPKGVEIKENALKWKAKAEMVVAKNGSSEQNIENFVNKLRSRLISGGLCSTTMDSSITP